MASNNSQAGLVIKGLLGFLAIVGLVASISGSAATTWFDQQLVDEARQYFAQGCVLVSLACLVESIGRYFLFSVVLICLLALYHFYSTEHNEPEPAPWTSTEKRREYARAWPIWKD